mmetsp:Transcript_139912/g.389993  ORF Transcript_139912/g.389993 Transcript_139912/m.389993 type:complete len:257 (+) Transcript_139912:290-1060(+)
MSFKLSSNLLSRASRAVTLAWNRPTRAAMSRPRSSSCSCLAVKSSASSSLFALSLEAKRCSSWLRSPAISMTRFVSWLRSPSMEATCSSKRARSAAASSALLASSILAASMEAKRCSSSAFSACAATNWPVSRPTSLWITALCDRMADFSPSTAATLCSSSLIASLAAETRPSSSALASSDAVALPSRLSASLPIKAIRSLIKALSSSTAMTLLVSLATSLMINACCASNLFLSIPAAATSSSNSSTLLWPLATCP